eukprot:jgi/Mesvir1/239/Mv13582-RA.1
MFHSMAALPGSSVCSSSSSLLKRSSFLGCGLASRGQLPQNAGKAQFRSAIPARAETVTFKGKTRVNLTLKKEHPQELLPRYLADIDRLFYLVFPDRNLSKPLRTHGDRRKWRISLDEYQVLFWRVRPHVDIEVWRDPQDDASGLPVMRLMATSCDLGRDLLPLLQAAHFKLDVHGKLYSTASPSSPTPLPYNPAHSHAATARALAKDGSGGASALHTAASAHNKSSAAHAHDGKATPGRVQVNAVAALGGHAKNSHGILPSGATTATTSLSPGSPPHPPKRHIKVDVDVQVQLRKVPALGLIPTDGLVLVGDSMVSAVLNAMEQTLNEEKLLTNYLDYCRTHHGASGRHVAGHHQRHGSGEVVNGASSKTGSEGKARLPG